MNRIKIGIDPGVNTGFAVSENNKILRVETFKIHEVMSNVIQLTIDIIFTPVHIRVEDARKITLPRHLQKHQNNSQLQGVGSVKRDCKIWEDFLTEICGKNSNFTFEMVDPRKCKFKKLSPEKFKQITKWQKRTSEHSRDAAMLIF